MKITTLILFLTAAASLPAQQPLISTPARAVAPIAYPTYAPTANTAMTQIITQLNRQQTQMNNAAAITSAQRRSYVPITVITKPAK